MRVEAAIRAMLLTDPAIAGKVGERIYNHLMPAGMRFPGLTLFLVSERPLHSLRGLTGTLEAMVQVSAWAEEGDTSAYAQVRELQAAIRKALVGQTFTDPESTITIQAITEDSTQTFVPDPATDVYQVASTFNVLYSEKE